MLYPQASLQPPVQLTVQRALHTPRDPFQVSSKRIDPGTHNAGLTLLEWRGKEGRTYFLHRVEETPGVRIETI